MLFNENFFPYIITIETRNFAKVIALNDIKFIPYLYYKRCVLTETIVGTNHQEFTHLTQMLADMRNIPFYFHKKTGMSKISDSGIAEILPLWPGPLHNCAHRLRGPRPDVGVPDKGCADVDPNAQVRDTRLKARHAVQDADGAAFALGG